MSTHPWIRRLEERLPPELTPAHLGLLLPLALGLALEQYDMSLLNSAINHVANDLGMSPGDVGRYAGWIRAGGLLTFLLVPLADRWGRRRLFLAALLGMSLGSAATSLVQTAAQFAALQLVTRSLMMTSFVTAVVIVVEEFPARHRAWGIGMLGTLAAAGYGAGLAAFAAIEVVPFGWRGLYALSALPLLAFPLLRRHVRETARFEQTSRAATLSGSLAAWWGPIAQLARETPGRAAALGAAGFLTAAGTITALQYLAVFVQEVHGWPPWKLSLTLIGGGVVGVLGNLVAGFAADRFGRRAVGFLAFLLQPVFAASLYLAPSQAVALAWAALLFVHTAGDIVLRALGSELFATTHRATALGWLVLLQTLGWTTGLLLASGSIATHADIPTTVATLTIATGIGAFLVLALPESGARELEDLTTGPEGPAD